MKVFLGCMNEESRITPEDDRAYITTNRETTKKNLESQHKFAKKPKILPFLLYKNRQK